MQNTLARRELMRILWNLAVTPDASIGGPVWNLWIPA